MDLAKDPILVFWETTRACLLACRHCRADAQPTLLPGELSTEEGIRFIAQLGGFDRRPVLILTGGDVLMRRDLDELIGVARAEGLPVALSPSVTPLLTDAAMQRFRGLGVSSVSLSLDGGCSSTHDGVRGVPGHFDDTRRALERLVSAGFTVQVNTAVMAANAEELAAIAQVVRDVGATSWEVFFLVRVGRGRGVAELSPAQNEDVGHFLVDASRYGFTVRTVEAPFFRRIAAWRKELDPSIDPVEAFGLGPLYARLASRLRDLLGDSWRSTRAATVGTRDGKGIVFVSHDGRVTPAGFLPVSLGSVRERSVVDIYREHPLLSAIREGRFNGRCGACSFRDLCGGSRARAYATSGDPLGEDPACAYIPA